MIINGNKIIDVFWFSSTVRQAKPCAQQKIGVVLLETQDNTSEVYIGITDKNSEQENIEHIVKWGVKISPITITTFYRFIIGDKHAK